MEALETQVLVIGAGAAGLYTALCAARHGASVVLISATPLAESSSYWAQGGLAAALASDDSPAAHLADTLAAGRGAVRESAARVLCEEAPRAVEDLTSLGFTFDADRRGRLALGLEGGHSARRIVHAGGAATGRRLIRQLSALVAQDERIEVLERRRAVELLSAEERCVGAALDDGSVIASAALVLATGGSAALWLRTTNPPGAAGGGLLLAHQAGAALADLELMQFHPTAVVAADGADGFLVTEAVRGEGARLLDGGGERFVDELAPRDVVARAIHAQMAATGSRSVALDMREVNPALFPNVVSALRRAGIDPERELVPVAPAAHYMMGGVVTDLLSRATLGGLYAVGECACTGLHGANRLASNSLTECFVFGARAAAAAVAEPSPERSAIASLRRTHAVPQATPTPARASRAALWEHAGLERDGAGLSRLTGDPDPLVRLIGHCALARTESRGAQVRRDFPELDPRLDRRHVTVTRGRQPTLARWS
ncbi:MAG: FAD-dependent oxidoreductase [Solirubrobacterales bacterium]|nr:FAD-dependent oxidoreductase [Solirubrobacterales bacterium]MBV9472627.1 FAD-dependent oxidoreductase [Solirubrobacterales bacterium]